MNIRKCNSEGYPDLTACEALRKIDRADRQTKKHRPLVFICSALAGDVERNLQNARWYSKFAVYQGAIPLAPHLLFPQFLNDADEAQRDLGRLFALVLMDRCSELWVFGSPPTEGMRLEITKARKRGLPIRFFTDQCEEVRQ